MILGLFSSKKESGSGLRRTQKIHHRDIMDMPDSAFSEIKMDGKIISRREHKKIVAELARGGRTKEGLEKDMRNAGFKDRLFGKRKQDIEIIEDYVAKKAAKEAELRQGGIKRAVSPYLRARAGDVSLGPGIGIAERIKAAGSRGVQTTEERIQAMKGGRLNIREDAQGDELTNKTQIGKDTPAPLSAPPPGASTSPTAPPPVTGNKPASPVTPPAPSSTPTSRPEPPSGLPLAPSK